MHIPDGFLSPAVSATAWVCAAAGFAATQVIASHDLDFVSRLCTRAVFLDRGVIVAQGPIDKLLSDQLLLRRHGLD